MKTFTLFEIFSVIIQILLLGGLGFFLSKKSILNDKATQFLTDLLIKICVPCLIFTNIIKHFTFKTQPNLTYFFILTFVMFGIGVVLSLIFIFLRHKKLPARETVSLISFQNSGYLPMNLVYFLFSSPEKETLLSYIFIYLLGFNILMWSVGSYFIFKKDTERFKISSLFNPPVTAVLLGLFFRRFLPELTLPEIIISPATMLGQMSFVLSMLVLGAGLAKAGFVSLGKARTADIILVSGIKLVLIPFLFIIFLARFRFVSLFGFFILLQACMPSAASLPIIAKWKKADFDYISQSVFFSHIFSLITIPFWINAFQRIGS
jgi:malate permease and related proteins